MKQYCIENETMICKIVLAQGKPETMCIRHPQGQIFFDGVEIRWNNQTVAATVQEIKTESDSITMTLGVEGEAVVLYRLSLPENGFREHICLKYKKGTRPENFEVLWKSDAKDTKILPVPIADHTKRPRILDGESLKGASVAAEGLVVLKGEYGLAIAKKPSDAEPVWVKAEGMDGCVGIAPASIAANRGFFDEKAEGEWEILDFHETQYLLFTGDMEQGCYTYRRYMADCGVTMPQDYQPPVNYCIYYECAKMDQASVNLNQDEIKECHSMTKEVVGDMAEIAKALHCDLLYLDQGWDTDFGSLIWDEARLGTTEEMVSALQAQGLQLGVLVPLHAAADSYQDAAYLKDENKTIKPGDPWHNFGICVCSDAYRKLRTERLKKLADAGVSFFSYDFHNYGTCFAENHGHRTPMTPYEHALALAQNQKEVKRLCKDVLIESYDWLDAGMYYYPVYMFGNGHHERWGFEYMWKPVEDYRCGRLQNLYYYNLSYEKPLYLHMNLEGIGENAEVFWYFASTVRHFGMGNFSALPEEKQALAKKVSAVYAQIKDYFSLGEFYGKGPLVHMHHLKQKGTVVNVFSDGTEACNKVVLHKAELGVDAIGEIKVLWGDAKVSADGDCVTITPVMQNYDAVVIEISAV